MKKSSRSKGLQKAIDACGSISALAKKIGVKYQSVQQWEDVPPERVPAVSEASGVTKHELRPDLHDK